MWSSCGEDISVVPEESFYIWYFFEREREVVFFCADFSHVSYRQIFEEKEWLRITDTKWSKSIYAIERIE